eukprot:5668031-Amphidinium_carterae.1
MPIPFEVAPTLESSCSRVGALSEVLACLSHCNNGALKMSHKPPTQRQSISSATPMFYVFQC